MATMLRRLRIKDQAYPGDGQQEVPLPAGSGESFKTTLSMGAPRLAQGRSREEKEIMQGLVDWREGEDSWGQ
jgi:hypothetical protein